MPFTPAHAIAAAPVWYLSKKSVPLPALVVGSVSPDFPYLLALTTVTAPGHTVGGLVTYCLIPSLVVLAIWYHWVEKPVLSLLQLSTCSRHRPPLNFVLSLSIGVLIGAMTHITWDASSHASGWLVQHYSWLRLDTFGLPVYKWNQYLGGIFGLAAITIWYGVARSSSDCSRATPKQYRIAFGIVLVTMLVFAFLSHRIHDSNSFEEFAVHSAVGSLTGFTLGVLIYAAWANHEVHNRT